MFLKCTEVASVKVDQSIHNIRYYMIHIIWTDNDFRQQWKPTPDSKQILKAQMENSNSVMVKKNSVFDYVNLQCCLLLEIFNFCFWNRLKGKAGNANLGNKKLFFQVSLKYFQVFKFYYLKLSKVKTKNLFDYFVLFSKILRHQTNWLWHIRIKWWIGHYQYRDRQFLIEIKVH